jgi:hypothetical protein
MNQDDKIKKLTEESLKLRETHVPIYKGCPNGPGDCNCTGDCQEITGWREKTPDDEPIWTNSTKDDGYWKTFNRFDMPAKKELVLLKEPNHFSEGDILVGTKNFIQKSCVPFVKYQGKYYKADAIEILHPDLFGKISSCRKYVICQLPKGMTQEEKYVYNFDL